MMGQQCMVTGTSSAAAAAGREREQRQGQKKLDKRECGEEGRQGVYSAQVAFYVFYHVPPPSHP